MNQDLLKYLKMKEAHATPIISVKGVGPKFALKLISKGIKTLGDALAYLPYRYEDRTNLLPIAKLTPGQTQGFMGEVVGYQQAGGGRRQILVAVIRDKTGFLSLKWFRGNFEWIMSRHPVGSQVSGFGPLKVFKGKLEVIHPDLETIDEEGEADQGVVPMYTDVEGINPKKLRAIMRLAVEEASRHAQCLVPDEALAAVGENPARWRNMGEVWRELHFPSQGGKGFEERIARLRGMLVIDEFFFLQLGLLTKKSQACGPSGIAFTPDFSIIKPFLKTLPFELTQAQRRVLTSIREDMQAPRPMHRLLQGDVGSGKTLVALLCALMAAESGYQTALMAPTEVLAEQHFKTVRKFLGDFPVGAALLTGSMAGERRDNAYADIASGRASIAIGTHALIQDNVEFGRLGLVIVDEQHRFGVLQRAELTKKGNNPDLLVMTATPIPRSLSMTVYGDLDLSVIDALPPGRQAITTKLMRGANGQAQAYAHVRREVLAGRQAYVVLPLVEESEKTDLRAATETYNQLTAEVFGDFTVGLLHGRMKGDEKESVLSGFNRGDIQVLVCTTVIEVGIDVPNATVMVIEHAERFGLSQLHQLRGRVGRGAHQSYCLLVYEDRVSDEGRQRLRIMESTRDGFVIAEEDLKLRGPGDMLGTRQAGLPDFRVGNIARDGAHMETARKMARAVLAQDPALARPQSEMLRKVLNERWADKLALVKSG